MTQQTPIKRLIEESIFSDRFKRQIRFIAGPRQAGKTTLAKRQLSATGCSHLYFNWDQKETRSRYRRDPQFLEHEISKMLSPKPYWVCFDEIHKRASRVNVILSWK